MRWPVPEQLVVAGLMNHVFNGDHALLLPLTLPKGLAPGTRLPLRAQAQWLACTDKICVPERGTLLVDLVVGDGRIAPKDQALFDQWRARLAMPLGSEGRFGQDNAHRFAPPRQCFSERPLVLRRNRKCPALCSTAKKRAQWR
jgi:DsbC/DsbD-like thiol-disulfide interchange protein